MGDESERRQHRRVNAQLEVKLRSGAETEPPGSGETRDVSEGGAGVVTTEKLVQGDRIEVEVLLQAADADRSTFRTMATVMWSAETDTGGYSAGLQFEGPTAESLDRLRQFMAGRPDD